MTDLATWLRAQLDTDEAHAKKDLRCLDRATAGGQWEIHYGYNLPYSLIKAEDVEVGRLTQHLTGLPDGGEDQHAMDGMLLGRAVKTLRRRAERTLAEVEVKRRILAEHAAVNNGAGKPDSEHCAACHSDRHYNPQGYPMPCPTVRLLALPYADQPGYLEEWRAHDPDHH